MRRRPNQEAGHERSNAYWGGNRYRDAAERAASRPRRSRTCPAAAGRPLPRRSATGLVSPSTRSARRCASWVPSWRWAWEYGVGNRKLCWVHVHRRRRSRSPSRVSDGEEDRLRRRRRGSPPSSPAPSTKGSAPDRSSGAGSSSTTAGRWTRSCASPLGRPSGSPSVRGRQRSPRARPRAEPGEGRRTKPTEISRNKAGTTLVGLCTRLRGLYFGGKLDDFTSIGRPSVTATGPAVASSNSVRSTMRTLAFVLGGVGAGGLAALLAFGRGHLAQAQQAAAPPDSITLPVISDTACAQGSPPADLLPPRHSRRPVQDPVPVLPLLGGGLARAGHPVDADLHGMPSGRRRERQREPRPRSRRSGRPGPRRSRSSGSGFTTSRGTPTSPISGTSRRWAPTPAPPATATSTRMPQVFKVNNMNNMGFCITCHVERKVSRDCTVCHY